MSSTLSRLKAVVQKKCYCKVNKVQTKVTKNIAFEYYFVTVVKLFQKYFALTLISLPLYTTLSTTLYHYILSARMLRRNENVYFCKM